MNPLFVFASEHADSATDACGPVFARPTPVPKRTSNVSRHSRPYPGVLRLRLAIAASLTAGGLIGFAGGYKSAMYVAVPAVTPPAMWMTWMASPQASRLPADPGAPRLAPQRLAATPVEPDSGSHLPAPAPGSIAISSRPDGATIALDGRVLGRTPLSIADVPEGTHVVGVELFGYSRWATAVQVRAGEHTRVDAWLTP